MSEKEMEMTVGPRADPSHRSQRNNGRCKDKFSSSSSSGGRRSHVDIPLLPLPPHHHHHHHHHQPVPRRARQKEGRRAGLSHGQGQELRGPGKAVGQPAQAEARERKMSLNHLLNFTVAPREKGGPGPARDPQRRRRTKTHSYNKEQFLQANCQFVVSAQGDYAVHSANPDLLVDWDRIELVRVFCHEIPSCPICLFPPQAAKITRCGHVYCWPCVLHYLSLGEKRWRKCPICYESIYKRDLKSVMALSTPRYCTGDVITMQLMVREKGTTRAIPRPEWAGALCGVPSLAGSGNFAKLLTATPSQVLWHIVQPERAALTAQLGSLTKEEASEQCFVELALEELKARELDLRQASAVQEEVDELMQDVEASGTSPQPLSGEGPLPSRALWMSLADGYVKGEGEPAFSESEEEEGERKAELEGGHSGSASSSLSEESPQMEPGAGSGDSPDSSLELLDSSPRKCGDSSLVYFYQAADGQHLYMHPVNARCLVKEYGSLEHAPDEIKARIVEMEQLSMTEEMRGRYKYLSHLPITCEFVLCELDLRPPVVSSETLGVFQDDLEKRRHKRARKKRDEKRREKKAKATQKPPESDAFPLPTSTYQLLSPERIHDLLPQLTSSPPLPTPSPSQLNPVAKEFVPGQSSHTGGTEEGPNEASPSSLSESPQAPSFAEALRGKPPPVWPIKQSPKQQAPTTAMQPGPAGQEERGEGAAPSFQEAFTEALLTAEVTTQRGNCSKKTAKKGRKKLVLFSTGGARGAHS